MIHTKIDMRGWSHNLISIVEAEAKAFFSHEYSKNNRNIKGKEEKKPKKKANKGV